MLFGTCVSLGLPGPWGEVGCCEHSYPNLLLLLFLPVPSSVLMLGAGNRADGWPLFSTSCLAPLIGVSWRPQGGHMGLGGTSLSTEAVLGFLQSGRVLQVSRRATHRVGLWSDTSGQIGGCPNVASRGAGIPCPLPQPPPDTDHPPALLSCRAWYGSNPSSPFSRQPASRSCLRVDFCFRRFPAGVVWRAGHPKEGRDGNHPSGAPAWTPLTPRFLMGLFSYLSSP